MIGCVSAATIFQIKNPETYASTPNFNNISRVSLLHGQGIVNKIIAVIDILYFRCIQVYWTRGNITITSLQSLIVAHNECSAFTSRCGCHWGVGVDLPPSLSDWYSRRRPRGILIGPIPFKRDGIDVGVPDAKYPDVAQETYITKSYRRRRHQQLLLLAYLVSPRPFKSANETTWRLVVMIFFVKNANKLFGKLI